MALAIVRTEHSADELRDAARRTTDTWQARRLLAIAPGSGRREPNGGGAGRRDGAPDAARLGDPL